MAEKRIKWTKQQLRAITARDSDVLVTASAGTGKTAVLSGRFADLVGDEQVHPEVGSFLVLTFTNAAAEQMRQRIAGQLREAFLKKGDPHLRRQLIMLQGADISTIHSFCNKLITEYFYKLGLDPTFRVIEGDEQRLLKAEVLEKTIDWAWQQSNLVPALQELFYRRDLRTTDGFLAKIIAVSDFLDGVVSRQDWYQRATVLAGTVNPLTSKLGEEQKKVVANKLRQILSQLRFAQRLYERENCGGREPAKWQESFAGTVRKCIEFLEAGDWDNCAGLIRNFEKPKVNKPDGLPEASAEIFKKTVKQAVDSFAQLSELAVIHPDYLDKVGSAVGAQTKVLIELVKRFDALYAKAKRSVNCLDFADLEHYALKLLSEQEGSQADLSPSETALSLREKYKYIFVDEYQDINSVQQAILDLLRRGGNVFGVGDVKQSIYAWRGAEPEIFLGLVKSASVESPASTGGLRVDLNANFRSAKGILDFLNKLFSRIMTASFAGIEYDDSAKLIPGLADESGGQTPERSDVVVEFHVLDKRDKDSEGRNNQTKQFSDAELSVISSRQCQAAVIARRIRQMVGAETGKAEFQIYDKLLDKFRDVEYRDIVILMRSLAKKAYFVEVLRLAGIPVSCEAIAGYFEATEISDLLSLLKVLDNPQRDIELAAVLRSPFFKLSDTELAKVKLHSSAEEQSVNFYDSILKYCVTGADGRLAGKLNKVIEQIEKWRGCARRGSLADLVWRIYRQSGFLSFVSALPNGRLRRANLLKLHDRAIQFEGFASSSGVPSLRRFVEFIEKLQELGQDWAPAEMDSSAENAVRVISVHKSKGLEFPVVFLAELDGQFNKNDIQAECLTSAADTLGLQIIDRSSNSRLSSLTHQVVAERKKQRLLAEEMRILYVATTRARDRLILTGSQKKAHCRDIVREGSLSQGQCLEQWQLQSCMSHFDWIVYGLSDQRSLHETFEMGLLDEAVDSNLFELKFYGQKELQQLSGYILKLKADKSRQKRAVVKRSKTKPTEGKLLKEVNKSLAWRYHFGDAPVVPAKRSVTQLTHRSDEYVRFDYSRALERQPVAVLAGEGDSTGPVEGRLIGTATHLVVANLDLTGPVTEEAIEETTKKLVAAKAIAGTVAEQIESKMILMFFRSKAAQKLLESDNVILREWPFTFALSAGEFSDSDARTVVAVDEIIVVQGIIDMLVRTPDGLVVIDFKTDRIDAEQVQQRAEVYRRQLELYSRAAGGILKEKVIGRWLYFLSIGSMVAV